MLALNHLTLGPIFLAASLASSHSLAGVIITQKIEVNINKTKSVAQHIWSLDQQKLHLAVKGSRGESQYIFNGRNLYVCSQADKQQINFLKKNFIDDAELIKKFQKGACQAAPTNFLVRFFMSPAAAVESIDQSDAMKLTLAVTDYTQRKSGEERKSGRLNCAPSERVYKIIKGDPKSPQPFRFTTNISEKLCLLTELNWREGLWRELSKIVLQQPQGQQLLGQLKSDYSKLKGFILEGRTALSSEAAGDTIAEDITIKTLSHKEGEISPKTFQLPAGFNVFSPENLPLIAAQMQKEKRPSSAAKDAGQNDDLLGQVQSVFFCAISGGLGCFR